MAIHKNEITQSDHEITLGNERIKEFKREVINGRKIYEFRMTSEGIGLTENQRKFARDIANSRVLSKYQKEYADYVLEEEQKILTHIQMIMENKNG